MRDEFTVYYVKDLIDQVHSPRMNVDRGNRRRWNTYL